MMEHGYILMQTVRSNISLYSFLTADVLRKMSNKAFEITDGCGTANIAKILLLVEG